MAEKRPQIDNGRYIFDFLKKSYNESLSLLTFSRNYYESRGRIDKVKLSRDDSIAYTLAMSTITTQLTSVTSWLLMCRAIQEGEIELEKLENDDFRMPDFNLDFNAQNPCFASLNDTVKEMLKRSSSLYNRIKRMENSITEQLRKRDCR